VAGCWWVQSVAGRFSWSAQQLREHDQNKGPHGGVQGDRDAVLAAAGKASVTKLFEDNLGQCGVGAATESGVG
jgi:hypothetical protein